MKILLTCTSSNSDLCWCQYAIVTLSDEARKEVLARRELHQMVKSRDADLWDLTFWGIPGEFYDDLNIEDLLTDEQHAAFESKDWVVLPDDFEDPVVDAARTECDRMVITVDGFYWKAIAKHTDVYVETATMPYEAVL